MPESAGTILRAWFEDVWNKRLSDHIEKYFGPHCVTHGMDEMGTGAVGPAGFRPFYEKLLAAFPDIHFDVHDVIEFGSMASIRWTAMMTHTGDAMGLPPTRQCFKVTGMSMARVEGNYMVESWNEWDRLAMLTGTGALTLTSLKLGAAS